MFFNTSKSSCYYQLIKVTCQTISTNHRARIKVYSDWPTFPQLYVNSELIGGLDIVREMSENNELVEALNAE